MSDTMTAQFATDPLIMASSRRRKPDALLHNSGQGGQYTSDQFQRLMAENDVTYTMSRSGKCCDGELLFFAEYRTERPQDLSYAQIRHGRTCSTTSSASTILRTVCKTGISSFGMPYANGGNVPNQAIPIDASPHERAAEVEKVKGACERPGLGLPVNHRLSWSNDEPMFFR